MAERRKRGTGSIRQKKCGTWEARYTAYRDEEGKVVRKNFCCDTKKECEERLRRACEKRDREEALKKEEAYRVAIENVEKHRLKSKTLTVKEWMDYWYLNLSKPYIRPSTAAGYENILEHHIYPYLGNVKLSELTPFEVQDLINYSFKCGNKYNLGKGLSAKTVKEIYRLLFQGMESGVAFEIINKNPCKGCKLPKIERNEMKYLTYDGIGRYLVAAEARGMLPMFYLELSTGLRRGELISLMWTDLDIHDRMLYIRRTANRVKANENIEMNINAGDMLESKANTEAIKNDVANLIINLQVTEEDKEVTCEYDIVWAWDSNADKYTSKDKTDTYTEIVTE